MLLLKSEGVSYLNPAPMPDEEPVLCRVQLHTVSRAGSPVGPLPAGCAAIKAFVAGLENISQGARVVATPIAIPPAAPGQGEGSLQVCRMLLLGCQAGFL